MRITWQPRARRRQTGRCTQSLGTQSQSISCGSPGAENLLSKKRSPEHNFFKKIFVAQFYQVGDAAPFELRRLTVAFSHTDSDKAGWNKNN